MDFSHRSTEIELMDKPGIDKATLSGVLTDIENANRLLGGNRATLHTLKQIISEYDGKVLTVLDAGCGGGAMLRNIADLCRKKQTKLNLIGIDINESILEIARERSVNYPEIRYFKKDLLSMEDDFTCDVLLCTLTMHHFRDKELLIFLRKLITISRIAVVINDLQRSKLAYYLFKVFSLIFIQTAIAKKDGLISVRSGFTLKELKSVSEQLPGLRHSIRKKWAFRYLWTIHKEAQS